MKKTAFATVGTTAHPRLVHQLALRPLLHQLRTQGYDRLIVQAGGTSIPEQLLPNAHEVGIKVDVFSYKQSIAEEIESADLVIAHAGAGTALEVLRSHKPLIVVVNEELMDNHQTELADALSREGYLLCCYPADMVQILRQLPATQLRPFPSPNQDAFRLHLDQVLFSSSTS